MRIAEEGLQYVKTREFAQRLNDTVEAALAKFGPGELATLTGSMFVAACLAGFARCGCPAFCSDELHKFHEAGGKKFMQEHAAEIQQAILGAAIGKGLVPRA